MGTNSRRKRGSIRLRKAVKAFLQVTLISALINDCDARDDGFQIGQAIGLALVEKEVNKSVSQAYEDSTIEFSLDDYTWTKRGYDGIRDAIRVN